MWQVKMVLHAVRILRARGSLRSLKPELIEEVADRMDDLLLDSTDFDFDRLKLRIAAFVLTSLGDELFSEDQTQNSASKNETLKKLASSIRV